ncbi:uncharacterized protein LOC115882464 [Sitophilus oryzae]|uniref:Uncharacterized protein LOC115882464 n=1 Tax=Sitophilus oryzae TaxID=7048 RepID=A0A6J2XY21_SITOR|nr:uncharacterized protein LOC115882464 [Sitophilus oryzae]XP_030756394.1 uncharacterized protein LOC115882464 [Sitophilus oryzae]XP_030756395.1 uncharacterized protein LOC115882464 [Sitophilus oryzae]
MPKCSLMPGLLLMGLTIIIELKKYWWRDMDMVEVLQYGLKTGLSSHILQCSSCKNSLSYLMNQSGRGNVLLHMVYYSMITIHILHISMTRLTSHMLMEQIEQNKLIELPAFSLKVFIFAASVAALLLLLIFNRIQQKILLLFHHI